MTIGQRIRMKREELGMTQEELATKLGYANRSSVNKVETSRELSLKKVKMYADALCTTPAYIMGWEEVRWNTDSQEVSYDDSITDDDIKRYTNYIMLEKRLRDVMDAMICDEVLANSILTYAEFIIDQRKES